MIVFSVVGLCVFISFFIFKHFLSIHVIFSHVRENLAKGVKWLLKAPRESFPSTSHEAAGGHRRSLLARAPQAGEVQALTPGDYPV